MSTIGLDSCSTEVDNAVGVYAVPVKEGVAMADIDVIVEVSALPPAESQRDETANETEESEQTDAAGSEIAPSQDPGISIITSTDSVDLHPDEVRDIVSPLSRPFKTLASMPPPPPTLESAHMSSTASTASDRERRLSSDRRGIPVLSRGKIVSLNEYTIVKKIGQGAFAEVKLGSLDGVYYAIKIIDVETIMKRRFGFGKPVDKERTDQQMDDTTREIEIMKLMIHPNLIELYEVLRDKDNKFIYLVMEFMAGGPLMKYNSSTSRFRSTISRALLGNNQGMMNEFWCRKTFKSLMSALAYLHRNFIVHRDLKPENILTDLSGNIKLGDFGVSRHFSEESAKETISLKRLALSQSRGRVMGTEGTWCFYSPEMCQEKPTPYSAYMADVWAASVCLYVFVFSVLPFFHAEVRTLFKDIREKDPCAMWPKNVSPELKDLIKKILDKDVGKRLSIDDIVNHPWMLIEDQVTDQMAAMDMFRESAEFSDSDEEGEDGKKHDSTMDTNFSDYFRSMLSEMVSTSVIDLGDSDDDDDLYGDEDDEKRLSARRDMSTQDSNYSMAESFMTESDDSKEDSKPGSSLFTPSPGSETSSAVRTHKRKGAGAGGSTSGSAVSMGSIRELENEEATPDIRNDVTSDEMRGAPVETVAGPDHEQADTSTQAPVSCCSIS